MNAFIAKEVKIKDLPESWYKDQLTSLVKDTKSLVWTCAKPGIIGDWAAYVGWPKMDELKDEHQTPEHSYYCTMVHSPTDVCGHGDKWDERSARELFPEMSGRYRR